MSGTAIARKIQPRPLQAAALRSRIEQEGREIVARIARREPAKLLAFNVGIRPRHSYNLRYAESDTRWPTFIMMAMQYPDLRAKVLEWLGAAGAEGSRDDAGRVLHEIAALLSRRLG